MRTWRRKCVPGVRSRWRRCHQSLRSASVGVARMTRARRRCGGTIVRSRLAQTRGSSSADMSSRSFCYPPPPHPPPPRGGGSPPPPPEGGGGEPPTCFLLYSPPSRGGCCCPPPPPPTTRGRERR